MHVFLTYDEDLTIVVQCFLLDLRYLVEVMVHVVRCLSIVSPIQSIDILMIGNIPCKCIHVPCIGTDYNDKRQRHAQSHHLDGSVKLVSSKESQVAFHLYCFAWHLRAWFSVL